MTKPIKLHFFNYASLAIMLSTLLIVCVGCYRMPGDDDCSLVPTTNNPDVTREKSGGLVPGGNF